MSFTVSFVLTCISLFGFVLSKSVHVSSSCNQLNDGLTYIKPTEDGQVIPVICDNGYAIIDISLNFDAITSYLSSNTVWFGYDDLTLYGPECSELISWREFWTPSDDNTQFRVSKDCTSCKSTESYGDNTGYYMTNYYHDRENAKPYSMNDCSTDIDTNSDSLSFSQERAIAMCNVCDDDFTLFEHNGKWTDCLSLQLDADTKMTEIADISIHDALRLVNDYSLVRPSVVDSGQYCTCYKPSKSSLQKYKINKSELPTVSNANGIESKIENIDSSIVWETYDSDSDDDDCDTKYYLSNDDFSDGTLEITKCGEYILTEDIVINFNPPPSTNTNSDSDVGDWSPNSIGLDDLYWFPTTAQADDDSGDYPGLDSFWGYYQLGFWAAIEIHTDYVTINLNDYSISMEYAFYLQQRVFTHIQLNDRQFRVKEGPAGLGMKAIVKPSHITIKDGTLGLTSHFAIHGIGASYVTIDNVNVENFDITGIQCNGCDYTTITNCVVGPQNSDIPVLGRYTHARALLPRLRYLMEEYGDEVIPFGTNNEYKSDITVSEMAGNLVTQMDLIYFHIIDGTEYSDDNDDWIAAKQLFLNENGILDAGSTYGIVLNGEGTAVGFIGNRWRKPAKTVKIENVEIYGIQIQTKEGYWTDKATNTIQGPFFEPLDWKTIENSDGKYIGDAYTDIIFAANELLQNDEMCWMNFIYVTPVRDWVFEDDDDALSAVQLRCGSDVQSHDAKGAIGMRIESQNDFEIKNVYIHDIVNYGALGDEVSCGSYAKIEWVVCNFEIEPGYIATRTQGMMVAYSSGSFKNIKIENIESQRGTAVGMALLEGSSISSLKHVKINAVTAGSVLSEDEVNALNIPNYSPYACSVQMGDSNDDKYTVSVDATHEVIGRNIFGYDYCDSDHLSGEMYKSISQNIDDSDMIMLNVNNVNGHYHLYKFVLIAIFIFGIVYCCLFNVNGARGGLTKKKKSKPVVDIIGAYGSVPRSEYQNLL